jgi:hypothetical protein
VDLEHCRNHGAGRCWAACEYFCGVRQAFHARERHRSTGCVVKTFRSKTSSSCA